MRMTDAGIALIKRFEGFSAKAYRCPAGSWTIGYGHTSMAGPPQVMRGMVVSEAEAETILRRDVERFADEVRQCLKRELGDAQFSALVSFTYNVGIGNFRSSSVLSAVNAGDFTAVPRRLQLWNKAGGRILTGLVRRRAAEAELFAENTPAADPVSVPRGKSALRSTTIAAACIALVSAATTSLLAAPHAGIGLVAIVFAAAAAACLWIIRERQRKASEEGI